jgi:hypothetical protein
MNGRSNMRLIAAAATIALAACSSPEQEAREEAAERSDEIVEAQTGQDYAGDGPREEAAEALGDAYVPSTDSVATSVNSPVVADLPAEVPEPEGN